MSSSSTRQRHPKRPHCFLCESLPSASSPSSAASTRQRRRRRSGATHEPTATSVPSSSTSIISSSTMASAGSSSAASLSVSLPSYSTSSIQQQQQRRRRRPRIVRVLVPTASPPSSSMATPPSVPSTPSTLPPSTMTSAAAGPSISSSSSPIPSLASVPSMPPSLAPSGATPMNVPSEPSFRDPALAERYWKYDHQKVSLSNAVAAELAFAAAPAFVKRVLGRWENPPWFWGQTNSVAWVTRITREDVAEEKCVCPICMEEYRELQPCYILLHCFHFFHKCCLLQWGAHCYAQGKAMNCPLCRSIVPISPISLLHIA